jgi:hypothetical protein
MGMGIAVRDRHVGVQVRIAGPAVAVQDVLNSARAPADDGWVGRSGLGNGLGSAMVAAAG